MCRWPKGYNLGPEHQGIDLSIPVRCADVVRSRNIACHAQPAEDAIRTKDAESVLILPVAEVRRTNGDIRLQERSDRYNHRPARILCASGFRGLNFERSGLNIEYSWALAVRKKRPTEKDPRYFFRQLRPPVNLQSKRLIEHESFRCRRSLIRWRAAALRIDGKRIYV